MSDRTKSPADSPDNRIAAKTLAECRARHWSMVRKNIPSYHDVEDIIQGAALCFWMTRAGLEGYRQPGAKLTKITKVMTVRFLTAQRDSERHEHQPIGWYAVVAASATPQSIAEGLELRQIIRAALPGLSDAEREAIILASLDSGHSRDNGRLPSNAITQVLQDTRTLIGSSLPFLQLRLATAPRTERLEVAL